MKHPVNKSEGSLAIFAILRRQTKPLRMKNRTNREPDLICCCLGWLINDRITLASVSASALVFAGTQSDRFPWRPVPPGAASAFGYQSNPDLSFGGVRLGRETLTLKHSLEDKTCSHRKMLPRRRLRTVRRRACFLPRPRRCAHIPFHVARNRHASSRW